MSIITEFKKFNRKYTIITHMQDSALPTDSEVLLEGVAVIYTPTGELKDAEKCKVGDGVTEFCNLPWLGEDVLVEDLTTELQRQDELLTSIETFLATIKSESNTEANEAYWYFVYNQYPAILAIREGHVCSDADPWEWAVEGEDTNTTVFSISPTVTYPLRLLDKTKTYKCVSVAGGGSGSSEPYYAKLTYGNPSKMWLLEYKSGNGWNWPGIYQNCIYTHQEDLVIQLSSPNGESREVGYGFNLDELDPTIEYNVMLFDGYDSTGVLKFDYPVNNDFDPNYSESEDEISGVVVEFPTEFEDVAGDGGSYPSNTVLRLSVGADTRLDEDQIIVEFYDREDSSLGTQTFTVASGSSVEFDFEGFGGESFYANGEHRIVVTYSIDGETFTEEYSANWP